MFYCSILQPLSTLWWGHHLRERCWYYIPKVHDVFRSIELFVGLTIFYRIFPHSDWLWRIICKILCHSHETLLWIWIMLCMNLHLTWLRQWWGLWLRVDHATRFWSHVGYPRPVALPIPRKAYDKVYQMVNYWWPQQHNQHGFIYDVTNVGCGI